MPGSPDPVLGSDAVTMAVAVVLAAAVVAVPFLREIPADLVTITVAGVGYALAALALWAGARFLTDSFMSFFVEHPLYSVGFFALAVVVLTLQLAVPYYLYARWGLVAPLAGLFVSTGIVTYAFLQVRGETDPIALYTLFFGWVFVAATGLLALLEEGVRRAAAAV